MTQECFRSENNGIEQFEVRRRRYRLLAPHSARATCFVVEFKNIRTTNATYTSVRLKR